MRQWTVTRVWRKIEATSVTDAIEKSRNWNHTDVSAVLNIPIAHELLELIRRARQEDGYADSDADREYAVELLDQFMPDLGSRVATLPDGYLDGSSESSL